MMRSLVVLCLVGVACLAALPCASVAQEATLVEAYGTGVHAYFQGNMSTAEAMFNQAINGGMEDPRVYYFRGLSRLDLGDRAQAEADFEKGAELEATNLNQAASIPRALEFVQGPNRVLLESFRADARQAVYEREQERLQERYAAMQEANARALEEMANAAPPLTSPVTTTPPTASSLIDPFEEPTGPADIAVAPTTDPLVGTTDPTTDPLVGTTDPLIGTTDPGTSVSVPSATLPADIPATFVPAEDPTAVLGALGGFFEKLNPASGLGGSVPFGGGFDSTDPFGGMDDSDDPFGDMDESTDPFGVDSFDSSDPFGGGSSDSSDPFGADSSDSSDPFGVDSSDSSDPFGGGSSDSSDPFGVDSSDSSDPFGVDSSDSSDPFGVDSSDSSDPFGVDSSDSSDPFAPRAPAPAPTPF
jgi:hypothetical protein